MRLDEFVFELCTINQLFEDTLFLKLPLELLIKIFKEKWQLVFFFSELIIIF